MRRLLLAVTGLLSLFSASCSKKPQRGDVPSELHKTFQVGQVWEWKAPPEFPDAQLKIVRIEEDRRGGVIVHVSLAGVSYGDGNTTVAHLPFAAAAVEESVTELVRAPQEFPDFQEGYGVWKSAYEAGEAGVFTIPVAEAYEVVTGVLHDSE